MKCTIRCELSRILMMIPILRWKYTLIMIIIMTIITFIITIITLSYPQNNTQHNPQDSMVTTPTTPTTWSLSIIWSWFSFWDSELGIGRYLPRTIFCKQSWTLDFFPLGNLIVKTCLAIYYLKWYYVKRSDVLQYHMMAKKNTLWHSTWFNNMLQWTCSHVRDTFCSPSRSVYRYSYIISFILYTVYKDTYCCHGFTVYKKNTEISAFMEPITKKTKSCRKHFWHRGRKW